MQHKQPFKVSRGRGFIRASRLPLKMSETGSEAATDKMKQARKLADDANKALELAKEAEAKAAQLRGGKGGKVYASDRGSEIRTKKLLGSIGSVFYKSWTSVLRGRPGKKGDPLGLSDGSSEAQQLKKARAVFKEFDTDESGTIDLEELKVGLRQVLHYDAEEDQVKRMLTEADENGDGLIQFSEFVKVVDAFRSQIQAESMLEEDRLKEAARSTAKVPVTKDKIQTTLANTPLVGNATQAVSALDSLLKDGTLRKWSSYQPTYRPVGADKMKAVTGMENAETDLGLNVDIITRLRYQGVGFLGLSGTVALVMAAFFPGPIRSDLVLYGYSTLAINIVASIFAAPIDRFLQKIQLDRTDRSGERWLRRQAGRFVAAYLCGIPLEKVEKNTMGNMDVEVFSRKSGNLDFNEMRKSITPEGFLALGLSEKECQLQAIVQMTGLVAEYKAFGQATFGYRFFRDLDRQLDLCQRLIDRQEKQIIARFGVTSAYNLLESHGDAVERVVAGLKEEMSVTELIAEIEAAGVQ